jgi:hypothetical protein
VNGNREGLTVSAGARPSSWQSIFGKVRLSFSAHFVGTVQACDFVDLSREMHLRFSSLTGLHVHFCYSGFWEEAL